MLHETRTTNTISGLRKKRIGKLNLHDNFFNNYNYCIFLRKYTIVSIIFKEILLCGHLIKYIRKL